jgi:hypothetical protein
VVVVVDANEAVVVRYEVRRMWLASRGVESWTVVGPDHCPVGVVDAFLGWLTWIERSPNTVEAYARELKVFWTFLSERGLEWEAVTIAELDEFAAWARRPAENVIVLSERAARRCARTVNRMLTAVVGFYEFQGRRGNRLATDLVCRRAAAAGTTSRSCTGSPPTVREGVRCACPSSTDVHARSRWSRWPRSSMPSTGRATGSGRGVGEADVAVGDVGVWADFLAAGAWR